METSLPTLFVRVYVNLPEGIAAKKLLCDGPMLKTINKSFRMTSFGERATIKAPLLQNLKLPQEVKRIGRTTRLCASQCYA